MRCILSSGNTPKGVFFSQCYAYQKKYVTLLFNFAVCVNRYVYIIIACTLAFQAATAQLYQRRADSLQSLLRKASSDTNRISLLGELSNTYINLGASPTARALAAQALTLSRQIPGNYYKAMAYHRLGYVYLMSAQNDSAIEQFNQSRQLLTADTVNLLSKKLYIRSTNNLAFAYDNKGYSEKALELIIAVLPMIEAVKDTVLYAVALHNVSAGLTTMQQYQKAYPYFRKDLSLRIQRGQPDELATVYLSGALLMYLMDSLETSKQYLDQVWIQLNVTGPTKLWGRYYSYLSFYYTGKKQYDLAAVASKKAFEQLKLYPGRENLYDAYDARKTLAAARGDFLQAREAAYTINKMANEDSVSTYMLSSLKDIAEFSKQAGDMKTAFHYLAQYTQLKDSIDKQQTALKMNELELRYRSSQKERQILELKTRANMQKLLLWSTMLLLTLTILFFIYRSKQKKIQTAQQLKSLEQTQQLQVSNALLIGEERERSRLARDLHDGLGGMLAGVKLNLSGMVYHYEQHRGSLELHPIIDQLDNSVKELRRIARNMMPESLLRSGLQSALKDLCENLAHPGTIIVLNAFHIQPHIPQQAQLMIYRLIQEIVGNAVKHAQASKIIVQCSQADTTFFITVEDNGTGFDPQREDLEGMGLNNIYSRVQFLKGSIHIDSSPEGTIINIELNVAA
ncbi:histidine kinase [Niabella sp. CC-SYL272]|uniref:ATP-binding protein n=1 Tax=Niabella agricola TaxID=2891571 RepID=UPI001F2ED124|nr:ATP-binding protein [Niabella agricola]MCF3111530.1 histidine kinase [Niabella agricola]